MEGLVDAVVDAKDAKKFEEKYLEELQHGNVSNSTKFEYSWSLIAGNDNKKVKKGIDLLEELCYTGDDEAKRDYLFYLSVANTKIGDYTRALECNTQFLAAEPNNYQAIELQTLIKKKLKSEGLQGMAIAGGAAAVIAVGVGVAVVTGVVRAVSAIKRRYL